MKLIDLTNQKFGQLTVKQKSSESRYGRVTWDCICDCGNQVLVTGQHLTRSKNSVKSCGCLKLIKGEAHRDWKGYKKFSGSFFTRIKNGARTDLRPHLKFEVTIEYLYELFENQKGLCRYSGIKLTIPEKWDDKHYTASLDRIDSSKGYVEGNVQWVHKDINKMKNSYTEDYFIELCRKVSNVNEEGVCPIK